MIKIYLKVNLTLLKMVHITLIIKRIKKGSTVSDSLVVSEFAEDVLESCELYR